MPLRYIICRSGKAQKLTFTAAPKVPRARPQARADFTHDPNKLRQISLENSKLVEKIAKISARGTGNADLGLPAEKKPDAIVPQHLKVAMTSSAAVNRRKAYDKIAHENMAMYNRLQAIKPSGDISRKKLEEEHKKNLEYKRNCSVYQREAAARRKKVIADREEGWQS
jgi:hypothetical protein